MGRFNYYLGKYENGMYVPVKEDLCETDIMSVVNFTSRFENEAALRTYLYNNGLIKWNDYLSYIIKKGNSYNAIPNGSHLTYANASCYNTLNGLIQTLRQEKYNIELYEFICNKLTATYQNAPVNVPQLVFFKPVLDEVNFATSMSREKYESSLDKRNLDKLIKDFVLASVVPYDKSTREYEIKNGDYNTDKRKLTNLILILNEYYEIKCREYQYLMEQINNSNNDEEFDDDEKEEFLTEEDFTLYGENPEDFSRLIRKPKNS